MGLSDSQKHPRTGLRLDEIAARFGGEVRGDPTVIVSQVASLSAAGPGQIAFLNNPLYCRQLRATRAGAVILSPAFADETDLPRLVHPNAYACYARVARVFNPGEQPPAGIHPGATVSSPIPPSVSIGAGSVIGSNVEIADNVVIHPGCIIGNNVSIGADSILYPRVTIYSDCKIGARAIIHSGAVIGADGFGFAHDEGQWIKIPQIGAVIIGDDVEIGANTTIDRGALGDTIIGSGVKLDNQIQIAHNCVIGENTAIAACAGIAGSARIGKRCQIGGAALIVGHLEIADDSTVSPGSMVMKNITRPGRYTGIYPLSTHREWLQGAARIRHLEALDDRVAALEKKLRKLEIVN